MPEIIGPTPGMSATRAETPVNVALTAASIAVQGLNVLGHNHNQKLVVLPNDFKGMMKLVGIESPKND